MPILSSRLFPACGLISSTIPRAPPFPSLRWTERTGAEGDCRPPLGCLSHQDARQQHPGAPAESLPGLLTFF